MDAVVVAVHLSHSHSFSKQPQEKIQLLAGLGILNDAHCGETVKHRSRVAKDPTQPNLRQVHLMHKELFDELAESGFKVEPGNLGENITTQRVDLLALPTGTELHIGPSAVVRVTGLRNPCAQINNFQNGLLKAVLDHDEKGNLIRKAGIMGVVVVGGEVSAGDEICVKYPPEPHTRLSVV